MDWIFVSPKVHMFTPSPNVMVLGDGAFGRLGSDEGMGVEPSWMELMPL